MNKKYIKIIGYFISAVFLYLTFKGTDFRLVFGELRHFNFYCIVGALICNFCFFIIRGFYQINNLYYIKSNIALSTSITSIGIAQFYNVIFPARFGEVIRTFYLSKKESIPKASIISYIFIEKVLDFLFIMFLLLLIILLGFVSIKLDMIPMFSFIILILIIGGLFTYIRFNYNMLSVLKKIIPKGTHELLHRFNAEVLTGFRFYKSFKQIAKSIVLLFVSWVMVAGVFWFVSYPYIKLLELPFYSCLVFMVFSALSLSVPSAPAGIGIMHYGLFLAVKLLSGTCLSSQPNLIAAFVIFAHFWIMLLDVVVGGGIMIYGRLRDRDIFYLSTKERK